MERLTIENFENVVSKEQGLFVIKFFSPTCGPCSTMKPVFDAFAKNNPNVKVYEVDTMESPEIANHFGVRGVPFTAFCENREVLYEFTGVTPLGNLQYVADNINDQHFRETGEFKKAEVKKKWTFEIIVAALVLLFIVLFSLPSFGAEIGDCSSLKDDCEYYSCVNEIKNCKKRSYLMGFGHKYCMKFSRKRDDFSPAGKQFIDDAKRCLIRNLDSMTDSEELTCREYKEVALSHHLPCYLEAGFCMLPKKDRYRVFRNIMKSMWRPSLIHSGIEILSSCKKLSSK